MWYEYVCSLLLRDRESELALWSLDCSFGTKKSQETSPFHILLCVRASCQSFTSLQQLRLITVKKQVEVERRELLLHDWYEVKFTASIGRTNQGTDLLDEDRFFSNIQCCLPT